MRKHDRRRHELRRFVAGVTKHQPLIARALFGRFFAIGCARIDALGDVRRLFGDDVLDVDLVRVKDIIVVYVTDLAHGLTDDFVDRKNRAERFVVSQIWNRDLPTNDNDIALGVGLAGNTTASILFNAGVENGIRNRVANFVGVTFTDGFGRKNVAT